MRYFSGKTLLIASALLLAVYATGYAGVSLQSRELWYTVKPGDKVVGSVVVSNQDAAPVTLKAYMEDVVFEAPYDGARNFVPAGSTERSCAEWVRLGLQDFIIPGRQQQEVSFTISVPEDAQGGYYAILFFEADTAPVDGEKAMGLIVRSGCSIFVETEDRLLKAGVEDFSLSNGVIEGELVNEGTSILVTQGSYYLMGKDGIVAGRGDLGKYYLPEGKSAHFKGTLDASLSAGTYTVMVNFGSRQGLAYIKEIDIKLDSGGSAQILAERD